MLMKVEAIDLFCGIGGLTYGLRQAEIDVLAGLDNDPSCAYAYRRNNNTDFICADLEDFEFEELSKLFSSDSIRVLVGCAPCQPFSSYSNKNKHREKDSRWNLINAFLNAVEIIEPHIVSMENVPGIVKTEVFRDFVSRLRKLEYELDYDIVYCPDFGVPQNRNRLVLLGSRLGKLNLPSGNVDKKDYASVRDLLGRLPEIEAGEVCATDPFHKSNGLRSINLERIRQSKPRGSWKDWDPKLVPECFKRATGKSYTPVYGRMAWDRVSPTITTQFYNYGSGRFGHPEQDRALSLREGALLQSFPPDYDFGEPVSVSRTGQHIGNAVPPLLGQAIGNVISAHARACHAR